MMIKADVSASAFFDIAIIKISKGIQLCTTEMIPVPGQMGIARMGIKCLSGKEGPLISVPS